jgi:mono/diheme cytochrome c family protein
VASAAAAAGAFAASSKLAFADDSVLHAPAYPWSFNGFFNSYDAASIRRGHQVYTQICATCHSLNRYDGSAARRAAGAWVRARFWPAWAAGTAREREAGPERSPREGVGEGGRTSDRRVRRVRWRGAGRRARAARLACLQLRRSCAGAPRVTHE